MGILMIHAGQVTAGADVDQDIRAVHRRQN
jgi:hypothetical protein